MVHGLHWPRGPAVFPGRLPPVPGGHRQSEALVRPKTSPVRPDKTHTAPPAPKDCFSLVPMGLYSAQTETPQGAGIQWRDRRAVAACSPAAALFPGFRSWPCGHGKEKHLSESLSSDL